MVCAVFVNWGIQKIEVNNNQNSNGCVVNMR